MARASRVDFSLSGMRADAKRIAAGDKRAEQIVSRAASTLARRLKPEAARVIASDVLNLPASRIGKYLTSTRSKTKSTDAVVLSASKTRLPLTDYKPRAGADGVTVTTWRDSGPQHYAHAFKRHDKAGIWQRVPYGPGLKTTTRAGARVTGRGEAPSGLVQRLPIVQRKGPSLHRVFQFGGKYASHVDIRPKLNGFAEQVFSAELARLIRSTP